MVQLLARLVAPPARVDEIVLALRAVLRPAHQARGCSFGQIYQCPNDSCRIEYVEEWDDAKALREELASERFRQLLGLLELAADRPVIEFRIISETHGLEYVDTELTKTPSACSQDRIG